MRPASTAAPRFDALAEPTVPVSQAVGHPARARRHGPVDGSLTPLQILLPKQVQHIAPHNKFLVIGLVHALGAVAAIVATPLVGRAV